MTQNPPIDWPAIKVAFEQGRSQHSLAREHGIAQPTISERAKRDGWHRPSIPIIPQVPPIIEPITDRQPNSPVDIADRAIADLAKYLDDTLIVDVKLELKEHKLFADSLSQYIKVKMLLPEDRPSASGIAAELLPYFSTEQLNEWTELEKAQTAIIETVQAQKLEQEQNIKTIRRAM